MDTQLVQYDITVEDFSGAGVFVGYSNGDALVAFGSIDPDPANVGVSQMVAIYDTPLDTNLNIVMSKIDPEANNAPEDIFDYIEFYDNLNVLISTVDRATDPYTFYGIAPSANTWTFTGGEVGLVDTQVYTLKFFKRASSGGDGGLWQGTWS